MRRSQSNRFDFSGSSWTRFVDPDKLGDDVPSAGFLIYPFNERWRKSVPVISSEAEGEVEKSLTIFTCLAARRLQDQANLGSSG